MHLYGEKPYEVTYGNGNEVWYEQYDGERCLVFNEFEGQGTSAPHCCARSSGPAVGPHCSRTMQEALVPTSDFQMPTGYGWALREVVQSLILAPSFTRRMILQRNGSLKPLLVLGYTFADFCSSSPLSQRLLKKSCLLTLCV